MDSSDDARVDSLLSLLWQQLHDHALVLTDAQGIIVHWGGAAPRVLGYRPQDVVGRPISIICTDEDVQRGVPELERSIAGTDGRSEDDRWHVRHDGARIWVTGTLTPLRSQGRLVGFAKILRDRTDQRMEIEQCRNRLQTAELALASAEANFARIVHELRNSLGPIRSATDILSRNGPGSESGPPVAILRRQADVMQRLLSDLADAARVRSGKGGLRLRPLDLVEEIAHICDSVRAKAQAMQQDLVVLLPRAPLPVQADRDRLHQIAFNLLDNAIKYTPSGRRIWVKLTDEGDMAVLRIQDEGVGIAPALMPAIFELFTQENLHDAQGGFGVGLAVVRDLVQAHDGIVEARSDGKGKGSEFTVRLPLDRPA